MDETKETTNENAIETTGYYDPEAQSTKSVMGSGTPTGGIYVTDTNSPKFVPVSDWDKYFTFFHGANFPISIMDNVEYKDVNDDIAALINRIETLRDAEDYLSASTLINTNKDILEPYIIDSKVINRLFEEQRNTEIWASQEGQNIYFTTPFQKNINDVLVDEVDYSYPIAKAPFDVINMNYTTSGNRINVSWSHPGYYDGEYGKNPWKEDIICYKRDTVPVDEKDGYIFKNTLNSCTINIINLPSNTVNIYLRVFPVSTSGKVNRSFRNIIRIPVKTRVISW